MRRHAGAVLGEVLDNLRVRASPVDQLMRRIAEGDRRAFRLLYDLEAPRLKALALRITGGAGSAEDVLHDVFLSIWRDPARYDAARSPGRSWLTTLVRFRCLEVLRQAGRQPTRTDVTDMQDDAPGPFEDLVQTSEARRLQACLSRLDQTRQHLIRRSFLDGLSHEALAQETNRPLGTVKSLIRRGLAELKACLEP